MAKVKRNDLCPCGSLLKYKCCCGRPSGQNQSFSRRSFDWMATFIEKNLSNRVDTLRRAFQREYFEVYAAWAGDPIHTKSPAEYDTHRCWRMVEIADQQLEHIARNYPRRFLIK